MAQGAVLVEQHRLNLTEIGATQEQAGHGGRNPKARSQWMTAWQGLPPNPG
jgi:hypothetical protein